MCQDQENEFNVANTENELQTKQKKVINSYVLHCLESQIIAHIFVTRCLIVMGLNHKVAFLRGHHWVHFAHRLLCTVTMNSNFAILKTRNCFQLE